MAYTNKEILEETKNLVKEHVSSSKIFRKEVFNKLTHLEVKHTHNSQSIYYLKWITGGLFISILYMAGWILAGGL